ncbi:MAG: alpha-(1-_3)-arabinofuranosyltransferase family protein, partial [Actinomycetota bacterium]
MALSGVVLAVGPHPFADPSPLWRLAVEHPRSAVSLALRSSTRAVPLVVLALALGIGTLLESWQHRQRSGNRSYRAHVAVLALVMVNAPAALQGRLIDPVMTRPQNLPQAWYDVADHLDRRFEAGEIGSVLLVPGLESAAYRWGYPVDPILPALTKKPFISRDWLPLGSAPFMDLLYALDDSFQSGTADPAAIAPVARMLGADTVMVVNSSQYERFGTIRPERAASILGADPPGLRRVASFGTPTVNRAPEDRWSEEGLGFPFSSLPEIVLYAVEDPSSPARTSAGPVVVAADGTGLVDLAALGVLDGRDIVLAEAALDDDTLRRAVASAPEVIVTDSNRLRAHHWRSSQDVWGATEPVSGILLDQDLFDSRLPVFPRADDSSRTLIEETPISARATSYGPFLTYQPEFRPAMAVDGDPRTAWRVGVNADPIGQVIEISTANDPIERLTLVQPDPAWRWITAVEYRIDGGSWTQLELGAESRTAGGQELILQRPSRSVSLRIADIEARPPYDRNHGPGVGFAEVIPDGRSEVVRVPERLTSFLAEDTPLSFAFTRRRSDPYQPWRQDPEIELVRSFTL